MPLRISSSKWKMGTRMLDITGPSDYRCRNSLRRRSAYLEHITIEFGRPAPNHQTDLYNEDLENEDLESACCAYCIKVKVEVGLKRSEELAA